MTKKPASVDRKSSLSLALRAGYVIDSGALLYLLAGSAWTDFETRYARGQQRVHLDETEQGWRFGGGIEMLVSDRVHLRMDIPRPASTTSRWTMSPGGTGSTARSA